MWFQLAIFLVSAVINAAVRSKTTAPKAAALSDFDFPQSTEGTAQIFVFGDVWLDDWCVVGVGNYRTEPVRR